MNRALFSNRSANFMRGIALIASFLFMPVSVSAWSYDDYLLATEKAGKTLAEGISAGADNTQALYGTALSSLDPSAYFEYSNNLGTSFANTLTQGMGASQDLSQKMWNTDPYGHLTANIADTWDSIGNYFGNFFKKTSPTQPTPAPEISTPAEGGVGTPTDGIDTTPAPDSTSTPTPTPEPTPPIEPPPPTEGDTLVPAPDITLTTPTASQ